MGSNRLQLLRALRLRRKTVLVTVCLGVLVTAGVVVLMPRKYISRGSILLRLGRENLSVDPTVTSDITLSPDRKRENEINSEIQIFKSLSVAEQAVQKLGAETILAGGGDDEGEASGAVPRLVGTLREKLGGVDDFLVSNGLREPLTPEQAAIRKIQLSFLVTPVRNSEVIELAYRHADAERAREILATLLDLYLERHIEVRKTHGVIDFFEEQSNQVELDLKTREDRLTRFREENEIHSIKLEREILLQKIADVEKEAADFRGWVDGEEKRRLRFVQEFEAQPERLEAEIVDGKPNYGLTPVYERLAHLTIQESSLSSRYTDTYPPLRDVREQLAELRGFLGELPPTLTEDATRPNQVKINLNSEIVHSEAKLLSLREKLAKKENFLARVEARLDHLETLETAEKRMVWEIELARRRLSKSLTDLDEARTSSALDLEKISNVSVIDAPTQPMKPEGPSRLTLLVLGLGATVFFAVGLALVLEYADRTFKSPEEVSELLQIPTLATVRKGYELESFAKI